MRTIRGMDELVAAEGQALGVTDWHEVTQQKIDAFAETTGDRYWIHVDPDRARSGPIGPRSRTACSLSGSARPV